MAKRKAVTAQVLPSKAKHLPAKRPRRASQRAGLSIDLAERALRNLMVEQCISESSHLTVYRGSRAEMLAAGIPEAAFPIDSTEIEFQVQTLSCCGTGFRETLHGSMQRFDGGFELEIDWRGISPYVQHSHPAIVELARMMLKDISSWKDGLFGSPDLAHTMDELALDERATDYKPQAGAPRLQITPEFHQKIGQYAMCVYNWVINNAEVLPLSYATAKQPPRLSLVSVKETTHGN